MSGKRIKSFSFKWKIIENYTAAVIGGLFLWLFVNGVVNSDSISFWTSILILALAPFLVTYIDKKSLGQ